MIEDVMDYDQFNGAYKQVAPLQPPPINNSISVRPPVSPGFDNLMGRSSTAPWSPAPLDGPQYDKTSTNRMSPNNQLAKSSDMWSNNNPYAKTSDIWTNNNTNSKSPDIWTNNNPNPKSPDVWTNNNTNQKSADIWTNNNTNLKTPDMWTSNSVTPKPADVWTNNALTKSSNSWTPNNTFGKPPDSTMNSANSSNAQMIKSSEKKSGFITDRCSPRCKLGLLGFIIGLLAVGIAVAVVLVLWLRQ